MNVRKIIKEEIRKILEEVEFAGAQNEMPMIIQSPKGYHLGMAEVGVGGKMFTRSIESPAFRNSSEVCKFYSNWDPSRASMEESVVVEDGGRGYTVVGDPEKVCVVNEQDGFDYAGEEREYEDKKNYEQEMNGIVGVDILNNYPFSELPETRMDATAEFHRNGLPGWGKIQIPSISNADSLTTISSKADLIGMDWPAKKRSHPLKDLPAQKDDGYIETFKKVYGEEPIFVINPGEVWYNKVQVVNPKFVEKRKKGVETKAGALKDFGTTAESLAKKIVDTPTMDTPTGTLFVMSMGESKK